MLYEKMRGMVGIPRRVIAGRKLFIFEANVPTIEQMVVDGSLDQEN